jgi:hypothetical protein
MRLAFVISDTSPVYFNFLASMIVDGRETVDIRLSVPFWEEMGTPPVVFQRVCKMLISRKLLHYDFQECASDCGHAGYGAVNFRWRFAVRDLSRRT